MMLSLVSILSLLPLLVSSVPCRPASNRFAFRTQHGHNIKRDIASSEAQAVILPKTPNATTTSAASLANPVATGDTITHTTSPTAVVLFLPPDYASPTPAAVTPQSAEPQRPLVMAYYPDWAGSTFPPEKIDFQRFDWIDFAFALPDQNFNLTWDDPTGAPALLQRLVNAAHANGKRVKLSIGGWTGSQQFSPAVASTASRQVFAKNILSLYTLFGLDGIDIDWEYPGQYGSEGNKVNPGDSANYLKFLQLLRSTLPPSAMITAAVQPETFADSNGHPMEEISEFAKVLDWVLIMNYDVWGSSQSPGPNAPMYNACHNSTQPDANAVSAFNAWTSAGFPASKLVLGLPSYGYISKSSATTLQTRSRLFSRNGKGSDSVSSMLQVLNEDGTPDGGQIQFRDLVNQGALVKNTNTPRPLYIGGAGFERVWDKCSNTPFLRSPVGQVVTYDDPESLELKAAFAKKVGMMGVNMFDVHGDTEEWDLVDAIRKGLELA